MPTPQGRQRQRSQLLAELKSLSHALGGGDSSNCLPDDGGRLRSRIVHARKLRRRRGRRPPHSAGRQRDVGHGFREPDGVTVCGRQFSEIQKK